MKKQNYGIEIELTGITRENAAKAMAVYFGSSVNYAGTGYDTWTAQDGKGRIWKAMRDCSIRATLKEGTVLSENVASTYRCEIVSPILQYDDIETVQEIIRILRKKGAVANDSCGIHVHVGAERYTAQHLRNLVNLVASRETMIAHALDIMPSRMYYCQFADKAFVQRLNSLKPTCRWDVQGIWYDGKDESHMHYSDTRYRMLNLHATWTKGTVEFRCFNGTTHAGKIKAYIQFCLAISHQALTQRSATYKPVETDNEKYTFRCWLLRLGLIGDEFKTARLHLMANLQGNSAWRHAA